MARRFAAEKPAVALELLEHVAVADLGAHEGDAEFAEAALEGVVGHQRADNARDWALQHAVAHDHVEEFVAVVDVALGVRHDQAVRVAVEAHRDVAAVLGGKAREVLGVGRAHAVVDVEAVWSVAHGDHFGAEFVEDVGRNVIGGAVGTVDENAQALEVRAEIDRRLAELDVAAGRIVKAAGLAEFGRRHAGAARVELVLDAELDGVGQLRTFA